MSANQVSHSLGKHNGWRIQIAIGYVWENGSVNDPETDNAINATFGVDHGLGIRPHATGAAWVVGAFCVCCYKSVELRITLASSRQD